MEKTDDIRLKSWFEKEHKTQQARIFIPQKWQECVFFKDFFEKMVDISDRGWYHTHELQLTGGENTMMMPNVSMNKMAMNESVATTCCYAVALQNGNVEYWDMPHGGYLGSGWIYNWDLDPTNGAAIRANGWFNHPNDMAGVPLATLATAGNTLTRTQNPDGTTRWSVGGVPGTELMAWLSGQGSIGAACNHNDGTCRYYADWQSKAWVDGYHWDATSAHAGINAWQQPHPQVRYSS